ncbi:MAG TPA: hypothetical protein VGN17_27725 [Bryobacteraceae bacterium]|jgi:hypothetical protein
MNCRALAILLLAATAASAQWLHFPTAGIPRTRDGKPNLAAPTPKARDGHPDLSGLWMPSNDPNIKGTDGEPLPKLFIDVSMGLKPGEFTMTPAAEATFASRARNFQADDPLTTCKPLGGPRLDSIPAPIKIVQNPGLVILMHEMESIFRQIHTDGRKLPDDPLPSTLGYSTAQWNGDTLVVDTIGFHGDGWLDAVGHPYSEALHVAERYHRRDFGHMEIQIIIDDPQSYRKPFTITQMMEFLPDTDLLDYHCADNERDTKHFVLK